MMAFDIYGQHLRSGYCEVHPDVPEEYPCGRCMMEAERRQHEEEQRQAYEEEMRRAYIREQRQAYEEERENSPYARLERARKRIAQLEAAIEWACDEMECDAGWPVKNSIAQLRERAGMKGGTE